MGLGGVATDTSDVDQLYRAEAKACEPKARARRGPVPAGHEGPWGPPSLKTALSGAEIGPRSRSRGWSVRALRRDPSPIDARHCGVAATAQLAAVSERAAPRRQAHGARRAAWRSSSAECRLSAPGRMHRGELTTQTDRERQAAVGFATAVRRPCSRSRERNCDAEAADQSAARFLDGISVIVRGADNMSEYRTIDSRDESRSVLLQTQARGAAARPRAVVAEAPQRVFAGSSSSLRRTGSRVCETTAAAPSGALERI